MAYFNIWNVDGDLLEMSIPESEVISDFNKLAGSCASGILSDCAAPNCLSNNLCNSIASISNLFNS